MAKRSVKDLAVKGKRVIVRVDFNVPVDDQGKITDDTRMVESLPTIRLLRERGAKIILLAHFGRPKGKPNPKYSLSVVADHLKELLGDRVYFSPECVGPEAEASVAKLKDGDILLMENVRFHPEEEANDPAFATQLAKLGDIFVNDAFGAAHRAHASTAGIAAHVSQSAMGLLMQKELHYLQGELENPKHPFLVILGGSKVSDKIGVIKSLMERADIFLIGGAMAFTFLKSQGYDVGESRVESDKLALAQEILHLAEEKNIAFLLPTDAMETKELRQGAEAYNTEPYANGKAISPGWEGVDIGMDTIRRYKVEIAKAQTILWNGPVGVFEIPDFAHGTRALAEAVANNKEAIRIIGGGDSVTAVKQFGLADQMTFISTGGGASLELLEGKTLPGVAALSDA